MGTLFMRGLNATLGPLPPKPLGRQRRRIGLALIVLGTWTFFIPIVVLDPPVMGRTTWSAFGIALKVYQGQLPVSGGSIDLQMLEIALIYLLLPVAAWALYRPGPPKVLQAISCIGIGLELGGLNPTKALHLTLFGWHYFGYGGHDGHIKGGPGFWILPWIMPALLAICFAKHLDA